MPRYRETNGESRYLWNGARACCSPRWRRSGRNGRRAHLRPETADDYLIVASASGPAHPSELGGGGGVRSGVIPQPTDHTEVGTPGKGEQFPATARTATDVRSPMWNIVNERGRELDVLPDPGPDRPIPVVGLSPKR